MKIRWRFVIGVLLVISVLIIGYVYLIPQKTNYAKSVDVAELEGVQIINDMVPMVYASKEKAIFYYTFGLFVFDIQKQEIYRSIDLKAIDCHYINGSTYTEVVSTKDGNTIYIYNVGEKADGFMYEYDVEANNLTKVNRKEINDMYNIMLTADNPPVGYEKHEGAYSPVIAPIDKDMFVYMYSENSIPKDLQLIVYNQVNNEKVIYDVFHE